MGSGPVSVRIHADVRLTNGRTVTHRPMENGAQHAAIYPGLDSFTKGELAEYSEVMAARSRMALFVARSRRANHQLRGQS
jgi:hypothetical protein